MTTPSWLYPRASSAPRRWPPSSGCTSPRSGPRRRPGPRERGDVAGAQDTTSRKPEPAVLDLRSAGEWERWLERNHDVVPEGVWLRLLKKSAPDAGLSYPDAVEVALCFGWIDGQARKYDEVSRVQRFTPRRPRGVWSKVNTERAERLIVAG